MFRKALSVLLAAVLCICMLPSAVFALGYVWKTGGSDLDIQNGGTMLRSGKDFYFVQNGIFVQTEAGVQALSADNAKNLNLYGDYLYYTIGASVRRIPADGGKAEDLFQAQTDIDQFYVINNDFTYLSGGKVFKRTAAGTQTQLNTPAEVRSLIPTQYGALYLTGQTFDYTLWAGTNPLLSGVDSCYTDSGYLAVQIDNQNYMVRLERLFNNFAKASDLLDYNIHGTVSLASLLSPDVENEISEDNDNYALQCDFEALLREAGLTNGTAKLMTEDASTTAAAPMISEGQKNIVKRARQLTEIQWTPLENITQWGCYGVFQAETTYTGIPYGQPVNSNGYIGYGISLEGFAAAALDNTSKLYTTYSTYNKIAPYFSTDCSGYVSYAWGLTDRKTTYSLTNVAEQVGDQSLYSLQVGDALDKTSSHVVLISSLTYDENGAIIGLQVMEQTPVITRVTNYGQGQTRSLASFQSYYLNSGYVIYRNPQRDTVTYTPSPVVPLDGETVAGQKEPAPKSKTSAFIGGKSVTLTAVNAGSSIYYTLDGTNPSIYSTPYTGAISVYDTTKLRAIAVSGRYSDSSILEYTVKVPQVVTPSAVISSGVSSGTLVSSGAQIKLSASSTATIYYTLDGTEPTAASMTYTEPITITQPTTIRAIAEASGMRRSQTASFSYQVGKLLNITSSAGAGGSISPVGTSSVLETGTKTFAIKPSDGFAVSDVLVDGASVGAVLSYTFTNITADHSIKASFKSTAQLPFTDIGSDKWFYDAVNFVYAKGLFNGTSETAFSPDTTMTRGMFVTVLGRFAGLPSGLSSGVGLVTATGVNIRTGPSTDSEVAGFISNKNTVVQITSVSGDWYGIRYATVTGYIRKDLLKTYSGNYTDLIANLYYSPYVEWAALTGLADGVAGSTFSADSSITREDMCRLLYNYAVIYGKMLPKTVDKAVFTDDASISSGAKAAVYALQQAGIINGMGNGSFSPQGTATRAQVAKIFMSFSTAVG